MNVFKASFLACLTLFTVTVWGMSLNWPSHCELNRECIVIPFEKGMEISLLHRVSSLKSFDVLAAAPGKVIQIRNELSPKNECGTGLVIQHENSIQTSYCFLEKNSIVVHVGQKVGAGVLLGKMKNPTPESLPGFQFLVQSQGTIINPFEKQWWHDKNIHINEAIVVDNGLSNKSVEIASLLQKPLKMEQFTRDDSAIVAWFRIYHLLPGDKQKIVFYSPGGHIFRENKLNEVNEAQIDTIVSSGISLRENQIPDAYAGEWRVAYLYQHEEQAWRELSEMRFNLIRGTE